MEKKYYSIVLDSEPKLRAKNKKVKTPLNSEDQEIIDNMMMYVKDSLNEENQEKYGLQPATGLAAPQVGFNKQMFVARLEELVDDVIIETEYALVNPKIISHSEQQAFLGVGEGCLSVADVHEGNVYRPASITIEAYDAIKKEKVVFRVRGLTSIVLQHELDHLNGVLFYDHIDKNNPFKIIENAIEL